MSADLVSRAPYLKLDITGANHDVVMSKTGINYYELSEGWMFNQAIVKTPFALGLTKYMDYWRRVGRLGQICWQRQGSGRTGKSLLSMRGLRLNFNTLTRSNCLGTIFFEH